MSSQIYLRQSFYLAIASLSLLIIATIVAMMGTVPSGQEQFETISNATKYSADMNAAAPNLRIVLYIDALFALCYTSAIGFATLGFAANNRPLAWVAGLGIITVMMLDYWENITMVQSLDTLATGGKIGDLQIDYQAMISALKWHGAAAVLFAVSFLLPAKSIIELLLVWGTRLGLALSVPLFVVNAFGLRELASLAMLASMAGGFVLLALVTRQHSKSAIN